MLLVTIAVCVLLYFMMIIWKNLRKHSEDIFILPGLELILKIFSIWKSLISTILLPINKIWKKSETAVEIPKIHSTWAVLWNLIFCPNKAQDYQSQLGSFLFQVANSLCVLNQKEKIGRISWGGYNFIFFHHPETAQEVLKSQTLINKDWLYNVLKPWLGDCLFLSIGENWKKRRKILTPAFHFRILEDFQVTFNEHSNILIEKLKKMKKNEIFDVTEVISLCTFDIISNTAMKMRLNAQTQKDNAYIKAIKQIQFSIIQWFLKPWYWFPPIFNISSLGRNMKRNIEIIHQFDKKASISIKAILQNKIIFIIKIISKVIQKRKVALLMEQQNGEDKNNYNVSNEELILKKRREFLDLLLDYHRKDNSFTEKNIREEVDMLMFAGEDTAKLSISWTLYFLGRHQDVQEKVFQELNDIFAENKCRTIMTKDLRKMKYLECVIKESMRLYPPSPYIFRKCPKEMTLDKYVLPANSSLAVFIYAIHHNPTVYENPEIFNPDRFLPENSKNRHPFAFIPFSAGPRNCIGQVYAMAEIKTVVANIIAHFKVYSIDPRDKILLTSDLTLHSISGLRMTIEKRLVSQ